MMMFLVILFAIKLNARINIFTDKVIVKKLNFSIFSGIFNFFLAWTEIWDGRSCKIHFQIH